MAILPQSPGIYQISCAANNKVYIGSTGNLRSRWVDHRKRLRAGNHHALRLQHAWDKYGESAFEFQVLELVMFVEDLIACEQRWIDKTRCSDSHFGFNVRSIADSNAGVLYSQEAREKLRRAALGRKQSPEIIEKRTAPLRGRKQPPHAVEEVRRKNTGKKRTPEQCAHQSEIRRGIPAPAHAYERSAEVTSKYYLVTPPGGESFVIKNLRKFCRENNLSYAGLCEVASGRLLRHKGWICWRLPVPLGGLEKL